MNYLLEIVIFNVVIFTISGIIMAKEGEAWHDTGIPKGDTGPMQRAWIDSGKLRETYKESNDRKTGTFIGYIFLQTVLAYYIGGARTFFEGWFHGYIMWVAEIWFDALVVDCLWFCHSKKMIIPGTEDLVDAYHDYWHHIKYAVIGMFSQAVIALPVGLLVMWQ